jgi:hypothetical protein
LARIRALKIGFFKNERLAELSFAHRLLFAGLWVIADKEGRLEDRPKRIKAELFPYDEGLDVSAMLQDLARGGDPLIRRYIVNGAGYIVIPKFLDHQRPHASEVPSVLPEPPEWLEDPGIAQQNHDGVAAAPSRELKALPPRMGNGELINGNGDGNGVPAPAALIPVSYTPEDLVGLWNALASIEPNIPSVHALTDIRRKRCRKMLKDRPFEEWRTIIAKIGASDYCRGKTPPRPGFTNPWVATFDWLMNPSNALKVLEGNYDNRVAVTRGGNTPVVADKYAGITEGDHVA